MLDSIYSGRTSAAITSVQAVCPAASIKDLMQQHDATFIACAYMTLLGRGADPSGYLHYRKRLAVAGRMAVIAELYQSVEGRRNHPSLPGLEPAMRLHQLRNKPLIRHLMRFLTRAIQHPVPAISADTVPIADKHSSALASWDESWYVLAYPDVCRSGMVPLDHYFCVGLPQGRFPSREVFLNSLVDMAAFQQSHPDLDLGDVDALTAAIEQARTSGGEGLRDRTVLFDAGYYVKHNPDIGIGVDAALRHFIDKGALEGRPSTSHRHREDIVCEPLTYSEAPVSPAIRLVAFYELQGAIESPANAAETGSQLAKDVLAASHQDARHWLRRPAEPSLSCASLPAALPAQMRLASVHGVAAFCIFIKCDADSLEQVAQLQTLPNDQLFRAAFCLGVDIEPAWLAELGRKRSNETPYCGAAGAEFVARRVSALLNRGLYLAVAGRPILLLRQGVGATDASVMRAHLNVWRTCCRAAGVGEVHLCLTSNNGLSGSTRHQNFGFDSVIKFEPPGRGFQTMAESESADIPFNAQARDNPQPAQDSASEDARGHLQQPPAWRGVLTDWARSDAVRTPAASQRGSTPYLYAEWLDAAVSRRMSSAGDLVFVSAWNDWARQAVLEPDRLHGYAYLNRTREVVAKRSQPLVLNAALKAKTRRSHDIAVIVHLHYADVFESIAAALDNLGDATDLYFSVREGAFEAGRSIILKRYPAAVVVSYPNRGRDVFPYLCVLAHIEGLQYRAICKVHSKKSPHRSDGVRWRNDALHKLLGSREIIAGCLGALDRGAGMVAPAGHVINGFQHQGQNAHRLAELAARMGCADQLLRQYWFAAGTMFWFAPIAMRPLMALGLHLSPWQFEAEDGRVDGSMAHALERLIGLSVLHSGMRIAQSGGAPDLEISELAVPAASLQTLVGWP